VTPTWERQPVILLHVPKTGGTARAWSLRGQDDKVWMPGHEVRQSQCSVDNAVIVAYVRHPVERFKSAWAWHPDARWRKASDLALRIADEYPTLKDMPPYRKQSWWVNRDPENLMLFATESMTWTWPRLMGTLGIDAAPLPKPGERGYNGLRLTRRPELTPEAVDAINLFYADDRELWRCSTHREQTS
jgi:hypothetical protein